MTLTTLVSYPERGEFGDNKWRGNCSGRLLEDLFDFFRPRKVADFMVGSGTTAEVCKQRAIPCLALDLTPRWGGFDAVEDDIPESFDFGFLHPPYHDIIQYSGAMWGQPDPRDLSRCQDYSEFIRKLDVVVAKMLRACRKGGRVAVLVGDVKRRGQLYSIQRDMTWFGTPEQVIIKAQHNVESDKTHYSGKFIPIYHEYLLVFRKDDCYVVPVKTTQAVTADLRKSLKATWRDVVYAEWKNSAARLHSLTSTPRFRTAPRSPRTRNTGLIKYGRP
jgi:hypothetical protein